MDGNVHAKRPLTTLPSTRAARKETLTSRRAHVRRCNSEGTTTPDAMCPSSPSEAPEVSQTT
jgi:hypothetical protein